MRIARGTVTIAGRRVELQRRGGARGGCAGGSPRTCPQDPATNLNPSLRVGAFIGDVLATDDRARASRAAAILGALGRVHLPATPEFARRFPHQLSGGQQQRVLIASALASRAAADRARRADDRARRRHAGARAGGDPAPAQRARAGDGLRVPRPRGDLADRRPHRGHVRGPHRRDRADRRGALAPAPPLHARARRVDPRSRPSAIACTASPASRSASTTARRAARSCPAARRRCERCHERDAAARGPRRGPRRALLRGAAHAGARPPARSLATRPRAGEPLLRVDGLRAVHRGRGATVIAADDISFDIERGRCVALVGESGSGKTTIARSVAGLHPPAGGHDHARRRAARGAGRAASARPAPALPDRLPEPVRVAQPAPARSATRSAGPPASCAGSRAPRPTAEVVRLLERVRLPPRLARQFPARAVRRRAPAGRDRPRARGRTRPAHLRRDHLGARRLGPGRRDRAARRAARRARARAAVHHPRPRRRRRASPTTS